MSKPQHISEVIIKIASNPNDDFGKVLRQCPFIQKELLSRGLISFDDLSDNQIDTICEQAFLEDWIDGQEVMVHLYICHAILDIAIHLTSVHSHAHKIRLIGFISSRFSESSDTVVYE